MNEDLIIVDNVFDDPDSIVEYALSQTYYTGDLHPNQQNKHNWRGRRTMPIDDSDPEMFQYLSGALCQKIVETPYKSISSRSHMFFHSMNEEDKYNDKWMHRDTDSIWAAVVYLSKDPNKKCGTVVFHNGEIIEVDNVYNRLVMYKGDYLHSALGGFGDKLENSRITLTIFFSEFNISMV